MAMLEDTYGSDNVLDELPSDVVVGYYDYKPFAYKTEYWLDDIREGSDYADYYGYYSY